MADLTTLANVKAWLNVTSGTDDALISRLITAESGVIENFLGVAIAEQSYTETRDGPGAGRGAYEFIFANFPVTSVAVLTIDGIAIPPSPDGAVLQPGYGFDTRRLWLMPGGIYRFARGQKNVAVTYTAGYASTPPDVEQACIELVALRYSERTRTGQNSKSLGGETVSFVTKSMTDSILNALQPYKKVMPQ